VDCFDGLVGENLRHVLSFMDAKDSAWAYSFGWPYCEFSSHTCVIRDSSDVHYSFYLHSCKNSWYSDSCRNSSNLFGCIGVNHGQYVLLNKVYSQHEYEILMARVTEHMKSTGEWGEFFPLSLCPYPYNDTAAMDFYPLSESEVLAR